MPLWVVPTATKRRRAVVRNAVSGFGTGSAAGATGFSPSSLAFHPELRIGSSEDATTAQLATARTCPQHSSVSRLGAERTVRVANLWGQAGASQLRPLSAGDPPPAFATGSGEPLNAPLGRASRRGPW